MRRSSWRRAAASCHRALSARSTWMRDRTLRMRGRCTTLAAVHPVGMPDIRAVERVAPVRQAKPEVKVITIRECFIEAAQREGQFSAQHHARGADEVLIQQAAGKFALSYQSPTIARRFRFETAKHGVGVGERCFKHIPVRVHLLEVAKRKARRWPAIKRGNARRKLAGLQKIVRVQQRHVGGNGALKANIPGFRRAAARGGRYHGNARISDRFYCSNRLICRAVVNHEDFNIRRTGLQCGTNSIRDVAFRIVRRHHHSHPWHLRGCANHCSAGVAASAAAGRSHACLTCTRQLAVTSKAAPHDVGAQPSVMNSIADTLGAIGTKDSGELIDHRAPLIDAAGLLACRLPEARRRARIAKQAYARCGDLADTIAQNDLLSVGEIESLSSQARRYDGLGVGCRLDDLHARAAAVMDGAAHYTRAPVPRLEVVDETREGHPRDGRVIGTSVLAADADYCQLCIRKLRRAPGAKSLGRGYRPPVRSADSPLRRRTAPGVQ